MACKVRKMKILFRRSVRFNHSLRGTVAKTISALLLLAALMACSSPLAERPRQVNSPSTEEIAQVFATWKEALETGDPEIVAAKYSPNAVLLPTASNQVRYERASIVEYFTDFLAKNPIVDIVDSRIAILDPDTAIDTGIYRFRFGLGDTKTELVARFTYVYERIDRQWLIVNHHSSMMPESWSE